MVNKFKILLKEESGQIIVLFPLVMIVFLGLSALVTDVGYMYYQKSNLQKAADSAALAGAISTPKSTDSGVKNVINDLAKKNLKESATINIPNIDRSGGTVEVEITQDVPKFFSNILSSDHHSLTVRAKAKYSTQWNGEALPFINLDDNYSQGAKIEVWEKVGPGDFESLWKDDFDIFFPTEPANTYFEVKYKDGIEVTKGVVANIKQEVDNVYHQNKSVYLFSLSNQVIDSGKYYSSLKNKDVIPLDDIVLLKVKIDEYDYNAKTLKLTVEDSYDIAHNDYPEEYLNGDSMVTSKLIE